MACVTEIVGIFDILFITLDTLRYDVACSALREGKTPNIQGLLPRASWEKRHSPGSFTYSAHTAFFAGFLPTPAHPGKHTRHFAVAFPGSETIDDSTFVFDGPDIVTGLAGQGYHTVCIGGVGFFNEKSALARQLPSLFLESHWDESFGCTNPRSTELQIARACSSIEKVGDSQRLFLFLNVSATHQPNCFYIEGAVDDDRNTQAAALAYVDSCLPLLFESLKRRGDCFCIICSDHGTAYGDDGFKGHRLGHEVVYTVPYGEFFLRGTSLE